MFGTIKKLALCAAVFISTAAAMAETGASPMVMRVAAAANLAVPFKEIGAAFAKKEGIQPEFSFASTGKLAGQIINGAPFDVLAAADMDTPLKLYKDGLLAAAPVPFIEGKLILFTTRGDLNLKQGWAAALKNPSLKKIAVASPDMAPFGKAAMRALKKAGLDKTIEPKILTAENISQAAQFALTGADAGFIAKSSLHTPEMEKYLDKEGVNWVGISPDPAAPILEGAAVLKNAKNPEAAELFLKFLLSEEAAVIFKKYGYGPPGK
jgi:molybdate transport system substrate-binding protein